MITIDIKTIKLAENFLWKFCVGKGLAAKRKSNSKSFFDTVHFQNATTVPLYKIKYPYQDNSPVFGACGCFVQWQRLW